MTIPDSVTSIGGGAFGICSSLTSVKMGKETTYLVGSEISSVKTVYLSSPGAVKQITSSDVYPSCEDLYIKSSVTDIPVYVKTTYPYTSTVVEDGVTYTRYSINEIENLPNNNEQGSEDSNRSDPSDAPKDDSKKTDTAVIIISVVAAVAVLGAVVAVVVIKKKKR